MLYGLIIGIGGVISYIYTNNKLYKKYYITMANTKNEWAIYNNKNIKIINKNQLIFYHPFNIKKYSNKQKIHYFFSLISIVCINIIGFESYFQGYTKLYFNSNIFFNFKEILYLVIQLPIDIFVSLLINSTVFYLYHRLVHTKYLYKYIHRYHHAYLNPEPFDSLIGHPLDHTMSGFYQLLPMYIYKMHLLSFYRNSI